MTSKFWVKSCKFSSTVGMTLGLLMPGLPLLAVAPFWNLSEDSSFASSEELLIAQESCTAQDQFLTTNYQVEIYSCNGETFYLESTVLSNGATTTVRDIIFNEHSGSYEGTTYDEDGSEMKYVVGKYLRVTNNGDQVVYERTSKR